MSTHLTRDIATGVFKVVRDDGTTVDLTDASTPVAKGDVDAEVVPVLKANADQQYLLCVAWEPGKHDHIAKGVDGGRDFMTEADVEQAAWGLVAKHAGGASGLGHASFFDPTRTESHAKVVESYVYRGPDWPMKNTAGRDVVIKSGTWLVGLQCDDVAWELYKTGRVTGVSPQGFATRLTPRSAQ